MEHMEKHTQPQDLFEETKEKPVFSNETHEVESQAPQKSEAQEEKPRPKKSGDARFSLFTVLAFLLLLAAIPLYRAASEVAVIRSTPAPTDFAQITPPTVSPTPAQTLAPLPSATPAQGGEAAVPTPVFVQTAVVVNGKTVGVLASREAAEELLHDIKANYEAIIVEEGQLTSSFLDEVELEDAPDATELTTLEALYETLVNGRRPLKVETVLLIQSTASISYEEETKKDETLFAGLRVVESMGRTGESAVVTRIVYQNGEQKKKETGEQTVTRESENRVIRVGTLAQKSGEPGRREGKKGKDAEGLSFAAPVEGEIVSNFGRRNGSMHFGLDYEIDEGAYVYAAEAGVVVSVLVRGNYGLTVEVDHGNGFLTRYAHLQSALVALHDKVEKGQQIATAGAPQYGEKGGLHFELRIDGFAYNPRYYLP